MASYDAFISYCHAKDTPIAAALQSTAQKLGKPWYRRRALRIYRDETSQGATPALWNSIVHALGESRFMILIASREAAASPWVNKEVEYWLMHKSAGTLLIALTDGELAWDNVCGDFLQRQGAPLPPVLQGRFAAEPKWVDLRAYRAGTDKRDAKFTELAADFAAAIQGVPKEDLLSQEVRQQRRALGLAWSAVGLLVILAAGATWQWRNAASAEALAQKERDRAQQALLAGAARESLLLTREGRTEEAWHGLRNALKIANVAPSSPMPGIVSQAALSALVENRLGPELVLELRRSSPTTEDQKSKPAEPDVIAAFDATGERVAVAKGGDVAIWSTSDGSMQNRFTVLATVVQLFFHESENIFFLVAREESDEKVVLIDLASGHQRTFPMRECLDLVPCIADVGSERSALKDLQQYDGVREVIDGGLNGRALLVRRAESFAGVVSNRFYVFTGDSPIILDLTAQDVQHIPPAAGGLTLTAVAKNRPLIAVGTFDNPSIELYEINPAQQRTRLSIRKVKTLQASDGVSQLTLSDDGALLYWSSATSGSGQFGRRLASALDVETGRQIWSTNFEGHSVFGPAQNYIARSSVDAKTGLAVTNFINGRTSERLFSVPAIAVAFDPSGRLALVQIPVDRPPPGSGGRSAERSVLRLVELSAVTSFANDGSWPHAIPMYVKNRCETSVAPFLTLSTRIDRTWNQYDWHREISPPNFANEPAVRTDASSTFALHWRDEKFELRRNDAIIARGSRDDIVAVWPDFAALIQPEINMTVTFLNAPDDNSVIVTRRSTRDWEEPGEWYIYELNGSARSLITSGRFQRPQWRGYGSPDKIFFSLPRARAVAVHEDECTLTVLRLSDGEVLGQFHSIYASPDAVREIGDDLIAVFSSGSTASVQIFDYPGVNAGPSIVMSWEESYEGGVQDDSLPHVLVPFIGTDLALSSDGRFLTVQQCCDRGEKGTTMVLNVPPWGKRLRDLMVAESASNLPVTDPPCTGPCSSKVPKPAKATKSAAEPEPVLPRTIRTIPFRIEDNPVH